MSVDIVPVKYQIHKKGAIGFVKQFLKFTRIICKLEKRNNADTCVWMYKYNYGRFIKIYKI